MGFGEEAEREGNCQGWATCGRQLESGILEATFYMIPRSRRVGRAHVGVWMGVWMGVAVFTAVDKGSRDVGGGMLASIQTTLGLVFRESQTVHFLHVRIQVMSR